MFKLTEDQINEIRQNYYDSEDIIRRVAEEVNKYDMVETEKDFFELVVLATWQYSAFEMRVLLDIENGDISAPVANTIKNNMPGYLLMYESPENVVWREVKRKYDIIEDQNEYQYCLKKSQLEIDDE